MTHSSHFNYIYFAWKIRDTHSHDKTATCILNTFYLIEDIHIAELLCILSMLLCIINYCGTPVVDDLLDKKKEKSHQAQ